MRYLQSLKSYLFRLLVILLLTAFVLLFYLMTMLAYYKFRGEAAVLMLALKNYGIFLLYSVPLVVITASCFYFAFLGSDKKFTMIMVPIVSAVNAVILTVFFVAKIDFRVLEKPVRMTYAPDIREGVINSVKDFRIYAERMNRSSISGGLLFQRNAHVISGGSVGKDTLNVGTSQILSEGGLSPHRANFSIPRREAVRQIPETGVTRMVFGMYIDFVKKFRGLFASTFSGGGVLFSALAIFLMGIGFFGVISGIVVYFNDRQIMALSYAALFAISVVLFLALPYYLSLIALIRFGIKNAFFRVVLPSLTVGSLTAMIGYGLIELRQVILRRSGR